MSKEPDILLFGPEEDDPEDLPKVKAKKKVSGPVDAARTCEKCKGTSTRIVSNYEGRRAWCNGCGHNWGISMALATVIPDGLEGRGISKRTLVEPDWNLAFEDLDEIDGDGTR
jgi:hypothetical protein